MSQRRHISLVLDNIRSTHNVGSIFRTADAFAVEKIYCIGITPMPRDRFDRVRADFAKVSLGAEKTVLWESHGDARAILELHRKKGYFLAALEQGSGSIALSKVPGEKNILLILGNEKDGVEKKLLDLCDARVEIPMRGNKESLNVSVAAGIALSAIVGV